MQVSLKERIQHTIKAHKLLAPADKVIVAVSGGADSLALLHALHESGYTLHVATLDHGLRGEAGAADAQYVADLCTAWGIPVTQGHANLDPSATGQEATARRARYDFLAEVARQTGIRTIATAHHADDQAETVLMRLMRGAGLRGLMAMQHHAPLPYHPHLHLIRPLLDTRRQTIDAYCAQHGLIPRQDATNQDVMLLRNRIRHQTLPLLRQTTPHIDQHLIQLSQQAAQQYDFMQTELQQQAGHAITQTEQRISITRQAFSQLHPALQQHYIHRSLHQLAAQDMTFQHIRQACHIALTGQTGDIMPFPGALQLRLDYETLCLEYNDAPYPYAGPLLLADTPLNINVPGITSLPGTGWQLVVATTPLPPQVPQLKLTLASADTLQLRTRQPSDRITPAGLEGHTQTLKKWMINHKVPAAIRDQLPLLILNGEIVAFMYYPNWIHNTAFPTCIQAGNKVYTGFMHADHQC